MLDINVIGNRIKELRKQRGLTQNAFAEAIHVSFQAVSNWERGIAPPDLENLIHIADFFGILTDDLLRSKSEDLYLGVDGGGTKTEFVAVSESGVVQKRIMKSGCNPNDIGYWAMLEILMSGIAEILVAFPFIKSVFLGIAGITVGNYAKRLYNDIKKHYLKIDIKIKSDSFNLFALGNADMAVIAGTGSVVFARYENDYCRIGGWGYLLDDAGSAYGIGRDALRLALHEEDMHEPVSLTGRFLRKRLNTDTVWAHINTIYSEGRPYIAELASVVFDAYQKGDEKARQIIDRNAKALAEQLNAGRKLYGAGPVVIASGGVFEHYRDIMIEHIKQYSDVILIVNEMPPIYGACKNARIMAGHCIDDDFYENFKRTYRGITV